MRKTPQACLYCVVILAASLILGRGERPSRGAAAAADTNPPAAKSDQEQLEGLISDFAVLRGKARVEGADIIFKKINEMMLADERRLDFQDAIKLAKRAAGIARKIKCPRRRDYLQQAAEYVSLSKIGQQITMLTRALEKDPDNTTNRKRLVEFYLLYLDDPAKAGELASSDLSEDLRRVWQLACKDIRGLAPDELLFLGQWYIRSSTGTTPRAIRRARSYYAAFLKRYKPRNATYIKAIKQLARAEKMLDKAWPPMVAKIEATKSWQPVIYVHRDDHVRITATGTWQVYLRGAWRRGPGGRRRRGTATVGPEGGPDREGRYFLAGRIGEGRQFRIGSSLKSIARRSGILYMMMNRGEFAGRGGHLTVAASKCRPLGAARK